MKFSLVDRLRTSLRSGDAYGSADFQRTTCDSGHRQSHGMNGEPRRVQCHRPVAGEHDQCAIRENSDFDAKTTFFSSKMAEIEE
jgi:hypothetical protein